MPFNIEEKIYKTPEKCIRCGEPYKKNSAVPLSEKDGLATFHLTCPKCKTAVLFHVAVGREGVLTVITLTDAAKEDLDKLRSSNVVSTDDVIEAYQAIKLARD